MTTNKPPEHQQFFLDAIDKAIKEKHPTTLSATVAWIAKLTGADEPNSLHEDNAISLANCMRTLCESQGLCPSPQLVAALINQSLPIGVELGITYASDQDIKGTREEEHRWATCGQLDEHGGIHLLITTHREGTCVPLVSILPADRHARDEEIKILQASDREVDSAPGVWKYAFHYYVLIHPAADQSTARE